MTTNMFDAIWSNIKTNPFIKEHLQEECTEIDPIREVPYIVDGELNINMITIKGESVNKVGPKTIFRFGPTSGGLT